MTEQNIKFIGWAILFLIFIIILVICNKLIGGGFVYGFLLGILVGVVGYIACDKK
jgi:hypothetical protein